MSPEKRNVGNILRTYGSVCDLLSWNKNSHIICVVLIPQGLVL